MEGRNRALKAEVVIPFKSYRSLKAIWKAMVTDEENQPTPRASVKVKTHKRRLVFQIQADDISSLRATLNSNLRVLLAWRRIADSLN